MGQHPNLFPPILPVRSPHNVRLFASFDAPHLGANIPIGDQHFMDHYANEGVPAAQTTRRALNTAAARQMLIDHFSDNSDAAVGTPEHAAFYQELNAMGWPQGACSQPLRLVAVTNGSLSGIGQPNANDGGQAFWLNIYARRRMLLPFGLVFYLVRKIGESRAHFAPAFGGSRVALTY